METILTNNGMSTEEVIQAMENQINNFAGRLTTGEYKVILYNGQTPITTDNMESFIDCIVYDLDEDSTIQLKGNVMTIHTENEEIKLTGRKRMSQGEIILRKYLSEECYDGNIIIRDRLDPIEIEEENIKTIDDVFIRRCKDVVNIRMILDEDDPNYNNNWDCLLVRFKQNPSVEQVWQRC